MCNSSHRRRPRFSLDARKRGLYRPRYGAVICDRNSSTQGSGVWLIRGLDAEIAAEQTQLQLIRQESQTVGALLARGLAQKPRLLALQREEAEIEGTMGKNIAAIARARQTIGETQLHISELRTKRVNDAVKDYGDVLKEVFEFADRRAAAQDVLARTEIRAPLDGVVVNEAVHTPGGVVAPGATVMEIVPTDDRLVVDAKVEVADVE